MLRLHQPPAATRNQTEIVSMRNFETALGFPTELMFPDVDATTLAREDIAYKPQRAMQGGTGAWHDYVRKVLLPMPYRA